MSICLSSSDPASPTRRITPSPSQLPVLELAGKTLRGYCVEHHRDYEQDERLAGHVKVDVRTVLAQERGPRKLALWEGRKSAERPGERRDSTSALPLTSGAAVKVMRGPSGLSRAPP